MSAAINKQIQPTSDYHTTKLINIDIYIYVEIVQARDVVDYIDQLCNNYYHSSLTYLNKRVAKQRSCPVGLSISLCSKSVNVPLSGSIVHTTALTDDAASHARIP